MPQQSLIIDNWAGANYADPEDELIKLSHQPTQGGWLPIPGQGINAASIRNMDLHPKGLRKRKGSVLDVAIDLTIDDKEVWKEISNGDPNNLAINGVAYNGSNLWCAVGDDDGTDPYILTSPDGITWTVRTPTTSRAVDLNDVTYSSALSLWIAVGDANGSGGNKAYILTSPDGITWTERTPNKNFNLYGVAASNNEVVAVGAADGTDAYIERSTDAITWTEQTNNNRNFALNAVAVVDGVTFVAVGEADGTDAYIVTGVDGINWAEQANPLNITLNGVFGITASGFTVAVGEDDGTDAYIVSSSNLINWTNRANPKQFALNGVVYDVINGLWFSVGAADGTDAYIVTSTDAITWTERSNPKNFGLNAIAFNGADLFVGAGVADGTDAYMIRQPTGWTDDEVIGCPDPAWYDPATGTQIQIAVTKYSAYTKQSGSWVRLKDSSSNPYYHDTKVSKVTFARADGHLFIGTDNQNLIQVYRSGADLDAEMSNGNTYENAYGTGTNAMTGTWPRGAYMVVAIHERLGFTDGNVLIEYTPMAHTVSSGIWDLIGSTGGATHVAGEIRFMTTFVPEFSDSIQETLYVGTSEGIETLTGFEPYDNVVRIEGSPPPLNHRAYCRSGQWLIYQTIQGDIWATNGRATIDLGRRLKSLDQSGPLDAMNITTSKTKAFCFWNRKKKQAQFFHTTSSGLSTASSTFTNDSCEVLDFHQGEPFPGEPKESYERRVKCLHWEIDDPTRNAWFVSVYETEDDVLGVLANGNIYKLEQDDFDDDFDEVKIDARFRIPTFTAGAPTRLKQWFNASLRTLSSGDYDLTLDHYFDRSASIGLTQTMKQIQAGTTFDADKFTAGEPVKRSERINRRTEAIQTELRNNGLGETFTLVAMELPYEVGAEVI